MVTARTAGTTDGERENMADDQVALVTGATGTIGKAIAAELGARGAALMLTGRRKDALDDVAAELRERGARVETAVGDVTDPAHAEDAVARAAEAFGPITTLVNNAGGASAIGTSVADSDPLAWRETLLVDTYGPYLFAHAVLPSMLRERRGRIITVASRAGTAAIPGASDYVVAKTAVLRLAENIAVETRGTGVVAFSLHPGGILTRLNEEQVRRGLIPRERFPDSPEAAARMVGELAGGRYDVLSGAFLDVGDDLAALAGQRTDEPTRVLRVVDLPEPFTARPMY
ncbi:SDR family oxidoreductase [Amycolatopsis sp. NBC_00345]|uniref:SDR family NAD(P)-dependent oxidoreductase n=1 Tax=Amycolatopsis sp. NBC_00345 TaxID=2975955 RepID=UPI002E253277